MAPDLALARRLGVMRSRMAQLLQPEIETLPARVRRLLKARPAGAGRRPEELDDYEVASVEAGLDILLVAKSHAAELALNEVTLRVFSELQSFLDAGVNPLSTACAACPARTGRCASSSSTRRSRSPIACSARAMQPF